MVRETIINSKIVESPTQEESTTIILYNTYVFKRNFCIVDTTLIRKSRILEK